MVDKHQPEDFWQKVVPGRAEAIARWRGSLALACDMTDELAKGYKKLRAFLTEVDSAAMDDAAKKEHADSLSTITTHLREGIDYMQVHYPKDLSTPFMPNDAHKATIRDTKERLKPAIEAGIMMTRFFVHNLEKALKHTEGEDAADLRINLHDLQVIERHFQRGKQGLDTLLENRESSPSTPSSQR